MNYFKWFIPPAGMTEEQKRVIPTWIAVRTPYALLRIIETISKGSLKNIIGVESLPQNIKSKQFTDELGILFDKHGTDKRESGLDPIYGNLYDHNSLPLLVSKILNFLSKVPVARSSPDAVPVTPL